MILTITYMISAFIISHCSNMKTQDSYVMHPKSKTSSCEGVICIQMNLISASLLFSASYIINLEFESLEYCSQETSHNPDP